MRGPEIESDVISLLCPRADFTPQSNRKSESHVTLPPCIKSTRVSLSHLFGTGWWTLRDIVSTCPLYTFRPNDSLSNKERQMIFFFHRFALFTKGKNGSSQAWLHYCLVLPGSHWGGLTTGFHLLSGSKKFNYKHSAFTRLPNMAGFLWLTL